MKEYLNHLDQTPGEFKKKNNWNWVSLPELWNFQVILMCRKSLRTIGSDEGEIRKGSLEKWSEMTTWVWRQYLLHTEIISWRGSCATKARWETGCSAETPSLSGAQNPQWEMRRVWQANSGPCGASYGMQRVSSCRKWDAIKAFYEGDWHMIKFVFKKATHRMYWQDLRLATEICWQPVSRLLK